MKTINFSLNRVEQEENATLDTSKLLGSPVFPSNFLEANDINDNDYFVAQINLSEIKDPNGLLPERGWLYFFLDYEDLTPKVFYEQREPEEVVDDINEGFDKAFCGDTTALYMDFKGKGHFLLGDINEDLDLYSFTETDGYMVLLMLDALEFPPNHPILQFSILSKYDGYYIFLIKEEDLRKKDFSKVKFVDYGS